MSKRKTSTCSTFVDLREPRYDVSNSRRFFLRIGSVAALNWTLPPVAAFANNLPPSLSGAESKIVVTNGIRMHYVDQGKGPLVLLCHGFPECWYSWRHQIAALSAAGYRVVAPDLRGYGKSDSPKGVESYTILEIVNDLIGLLDALGEKSAVIVGHDFGAVVSWNAALLHPDKFKAVAALSVPYSPRREDAPIATFKKFANGNFFYILYFQEFGVAEKELNNEVEKSLRSFYYSSSYESESARSQFRRPSRPTKLLETLVDPGKPPSWLSQTDLMYYVTEFSRNGFAGPLNWYRNLDKNWELMTQFKDAKIQVPTVFISGERDPVRFQTKRNFDELPLNVPKLTKTVLIPECGHWTQQEKPTQVNTALLEFLKVVNA